MADCPYCDEDLEEWFNKQDISPYTGVFNCPECNGKVKCEYEEMYDGKEEHGYFWLAKDQDD